MLVLSRKKSETIEIEVDPADIVDGKLRIDIAVISFLGGRVRLGIEAPTAARIHRGEVAAAIRAEATQPTAAGVPA